MEEMKVLIGLLNTQREMERGRKRDGGGGEEERRREWRERGGEEKVRDK